LEVNFDEQCVKARFNQRIPKKTLAWVGVKLTKDSVGKAVSKAVPVVGGVISGGLTVATFLPMVRKLQKELSKFAAMPPESLYKANEEADVILTEFEILADNDDEESDNE
ncbi:MAG: hypothetical protein LUC36_00615, partial [Oscillospiraceae bacterium]|nr:hypothetical protein [Oscillospiraceae bacterium]